MHSGWKWIEWTQLEKENMLAIANYKVGVNGQCSGMCYHNSVYTLQQKGLKMAWASQTITRKT